MSGATLEGRRASHGRIVLPRYGIWHADLTIGSPDLLSGAVTVALGGLSLVGYVAFGDVYKGTARYLVRGGKGGWKTSIASRAYRSGADLFLSLVVRDAANDAGESVSFQADGDRTIGPAYTRPAGPAARTLSLLVESWWIDANGVTQIGSRPTGEITSVFDLVDYRPDDRVAVIASETPEAFENGKTVPLSGAPSMTIGDIVHLVDGQLHTELWAA